MKKNWLIILIAIIGCVLVSILILFFKNIFNQESISNQTSVSKASGIKISKVEKDEVITYVVDDNERNLTYTWSFPKTENYKNNIKDDLYIDLNLRLSIDAITNDTNTINEKVKQNKLIVTFDHHGTLPETATVRINVSNKFKDGEKLYLYYYNPDNNQIEYIDDGLKVKDGYVEFSIDHCSDYFLTASIVQEAVGNPKNINYIIIGLLVVVLLLVAVTLKQSKK